MTDETLEYLEIVDWDSYLHPDIRRKVGPPYRWCKLPVDQLDLAGDLSPRDYGAFCRLLLLAASTDNRVVFNPGWIRRRTGVSRRAIEVLANRNLIRIVAVTPETRKPETNQPEHSPDASSMQANLPQAAGTEGKGGEGRRLEGRGTAPPGISPNRRQPPFPEMLAVCQRAGVSGSDWNGIRNALEREFGMIATERQLQSLQNQLNDRAGK